MDSQQDVYRQIFDEVMEAVEKGALRDGHFVLIRVDGEALTDWFLEGKPILLENKNALKMALRSTSTWRKSS